MSAKVEILSRFAKFFHSLRFSASLEVQILSRLLARDIRSVTGMNLSLIRHLSRLDPWTVNTVQLKRALVAEEMVMVPPEDRWRLSYVLM